MVARVDDRASACRVGSNHLHPTNDRTTVGMVIREVLPGFGSQSLALTPSAWDLGSHEWVIMQVSVSMIPTILKLPSIGTVVMMFTRVT
jgi:hypothetical protein